MKKLLALLACGVMTTSLAACGSDNTSTDDSAKEEVKEEKEENKIYGIGETATIDDIDITVNSVREAQSNLGATMDAGTTYFVLDVSLANHTDDTFNSSSMICYSLKDADGREQDMVFDVDLNGSLDTEIPAGQNGAGEIGYKVPTEGSLFLTFTPRLGSDFVQFQVR